MSETTVTITGQDGVKIPAIVNDADMSAQPGVVLLHGLTTSKDEYQDAFRNLAHQLAQRHVPSVRFDFRGHGDSTAPLSEFTVYNQVFDILTVAEWCRTEDVINPKTLLAASMAAPAALCATYLMQEAVAKVVLLAPVLDLQSTFVWPTTDWTRENFGLERVRTAALGGAALEPEPGFRMSREFALDLLTLTVEQLLDRIACPITVLHGDDDGMVPFEVTRRIAASHPALRFHPMPNTGHGLAETGDEARIAERTKANTALLVSELLGAAQ